jgi:hypothetical protein
MEAPTVWQTQVFDRLYDFLMNYPEAFVAIPIVWVFMIFVFQRFLHVHISPWIVLLTLLVSAGIVIGIIFLFLQNNSAPPSSMSLLEPVL